MYSVIIFTFTISMGLFVNGQFGPIFPQQGGGQIQPIGPIQPIQPIQPNVQPVPGGMFPPNQVAQGPRDAWVYATCSFNQSNPNVMNNPAFRGRIDMRQQISGGPVFARIQVVGLPGSLMTDTERGLHVHEYGDVDNNCYASGPHYDSDSFSFHGSPNNMGNGNSHEGDMGNFRQSNNGNINVDVTLRNMVLAGDTGVIGRAVVLKEGRDDLGRGGTAMSLQTGNSGLPIACCVLGYSDSSNWNNPMFRMNQFPQNQNSNGFQGNNQQGFNQGNNQQGFNQGNNQQGFNQGNNQQGFNQPNNQANNPNFG